MKSHGEINQSTIKVLANNRHIFSCGSIVEAEQATKGQVHGNYCAGKEITLMRGSKILKKYIELS